ncbi:methyltransferase domain-containing protein [Celeribacter halophilus]|uniref:Methyltransferase domain-containing protein n=1 Tax=Celeribacter halophilus TaxID=576117 RepID=A0AAW7XWW9_9RHOB|nr:methyltransferase domain-containing protein [Celeribacter halophilus]MDO6458485.1 methyltransferase domain-containing protein [Celeribacter halophilus]MDO6724981.1 methyltransferase domain-containing protein [Celeribacter halophilus]
MSNTAPLVDRDQLARNRRRAVQMTGDFFLHDEARFEIEDRLSMVNKSFTAPAIVTGFPEIWAKWFPDATIVPDDDLLNLKEGAHDLVIHAMSLHWANDPVGQLIQCNRALKPDGLMLAVFLGDQTLNELRACLGQAESMITGGLSPRVLPMGELRELGALLQRASFALPVADKSLRKVAYPSLARMAADLRAMGEGNALSARKKEYSGRTLFETTEQLYREHFSEDNRLIATFDLVFLTGWAPDASQPKPLMPGSAKMSLADALRTKEIKLPE